MRIAQIAPLHEAVPPKLYGGTERVVSYLTEELVALGHQVTLFASGDSVTSACLHSVCPRSLRLDPAMRDVIAPHMLMMEEVRRRAEDFDVLHFHLDYWPFSIFTRQKVPFVTTLHGRLDLPELKPIFNAFRDVPVVSISDSQRLALPQAGFVATVPHGVPDMRLSSSTMKPVSLSSITSGTEPRLNAITGVPQLIASIITKPNGSGQSIGINRPTAPERKAGFSRSPISPIISTPGPSSIGRITASK